LAKPFSEQSMKIAYVPVRLEGQSHLYDDWRKKSARKA
jgi:hypothetical protein